MGGGGGGGIGASVGGLIGGVIGAGKAAGDKAKGQGYAESAMNELINIGMPPDLSKEIVLQKFQEAGILTPEMEQEINIAHSKLAEQQENPETRNAQMGALSQLQQLGKTGLGAQDKAALAQIRDQVQTDLEGKRQQILQNAQARGMGGSGAELIAQLQGSQSGANREAQEGLDVAGQAQNRALQALTQGAGLAGQVRGQDYTANTARAQAQDELNRFNTQNQQALQARNVYNKNAAQATNLSNKQNVSNANVSMANQEKERQAQAQRDYWNDLMGRAQTVSRGYSGLGDEYKGRAENIAKSEQALGTGIGGIADKAIKGVMSMGTSEMIPSMGGGGMAGGGMGGGAPNASGYSGANYMAAAHGGMVPGKAPVPGDSSKNDIVHADVSPGEVIIPRSIMEHENAPEEAKKFIHRVLGNRKPGHKTNFANGGEVQPLSDLEKLLQSYQQSQQPPVMSQMSPEQLAQPEPTPEPPVPEMQQEEVAQPQVQQMVPSKISTKKSIEESIPVPQPEQQPKQNPLSDILFGQNQLSTVDNLKNAQQAREADQDSADLMRYAAIAGRGLSGYENKDLKDMADLKEKRSGQKIENFEAQQKQLKEDPNSSISKGYRDMMKKFGVNIKGDASAADIEKIAPWIQKSYENEENRKAKSDDLKYKYSELATLSGLKAKEKETAGLEKEVYKMGDDMDPNKARTGELGKNQARLNAAGRVKALIEASGGNPSGIPMRELATTVGNMLTMGSQTAVQQINELVPHTMRGDAAKIQEWLTGDPTGRDQQQFVQMYSKIADREAATANDQMKDAFFQKAYTKYKHLKDKSPEDFYNNLSSATNMDPEEIKQMEAKKDFRGRYKASSEKKASPVSEDSGEEKRIAPDGQTAIFDKKTKQFLRYE